MGGRLFRFSFARRFRVIGGLVTLLLVAGVTFVPSARATKNWYVTIDKKVLPLFSSVYPNWQVGTSGTFSIVVAATSNSATLHPHTFTVTDQLPAGMTLTSVTGVGTPTSWSCSTSGQTFTCTLSIVQGNAGSVPEIKAGESLPPILVKAKVTQPPGPEGTYTNCAQLQGTGVDGQTSNSGSSCVTVTPVAVEELPAICIRKYWDMDGDGVHDPDEPWAPGWKFKVTGKKGVRVGRLVSAGAAVDCLSPGAGTYTVTEEARRGWKTTQPASGSRKVKLRSGHVRIVTFGNRPPSDLCVHKFEDLDRDGIQDPDEALLHDWQFEVTGPQGKNASTSLITTGASTGCLSVVPGVYQVTEIPQDGWVSTAPPSGTLNVTVPANQAKLVKFGNAREPCCLTFTYLGGRKDNFSISEGAEPSDPVPPVTQSQFDATDFNQTFSHGFDLGSGNCISAATLTTRVKSLGGGAEDNDTIGLRIPGGQAASWFLINLPGYTTAAPATLTFNLAALPSNQNGASITSLISSLDTNRELELHVQDDTSVDFVELNVEFCECNKGAGTPSS